MDIVAIQEFPEYSISVRGEVINERTGRTMTLSPTEHGDLTVGLMKDGWQYRRSVKVLVARAFVEGEDDIFNTPIQLDGNKNNLHASNIMWRPRWFAWKYSRQFEGIHKELLRVYRDFPLIEITESIRYDSILEAATTNGLLFHDVYQSARHQTHVFPTAQIFMFV